MRKFKTYLLFATSCAIVVAFAHLPGAASNVDDQNRGCSVASLKGTYVFRRTGVNNALGGPIAQIGIEVFRGDGTRGPVRSTRSNNGEIQDWTNSPPIGTYTIDSDCTGSFFDTDGNKTNNVIVFEGGTRFLLLSVAPDTITTEEGTRLEVKKKE